MAVDSRVALAKLTSGQTLTTEERQVLGLAAAPASAPIAPRNDSAAAKAQRILEQEDAAATAYQNALTAPLKTQAEVDAINAGVKTATEASGNVYDPLRALTTGTQATINPDVIAQRSTLNTSSPNTQQMDAIAAITALLNSYGIGGLAGPITNAVMKGYSSDTIELIMQDPNSSDPLALAFQKRFPANKVRAAAGKSVLSPAEYLRAERTYTEVLKSYGVQSMATQDNISSFLTNDVSATEVADRVGLAVDRVNNADPATKEALKTFYPMLTQGDLVQAVLNPAESLPQLKRKIQTAEIGGAAAAQKLTMGLADITTKSDLYGNVTGGTMGADTLAGLGVTKAQAQAGYANIAEVLPRAEFLSSITGGEDYTQKQAEQEQFQRLASAKRAREALASAEQARFSGSAGRLASKDRSQGLI